MFLSYMSYKILVHFVFCVCVVTNLTDILNQFSCLNTFVTQILIVVS